MTRTYKRFAQEVKMGMWAAGSALHVVDAKKGEAGVQESTLIE